MPRALSRLTRYAFAALAGIGIVSCGGGGVSGPPPVVDPSRITILPDTATLYSGVPTTFVISGGTGSYIVSSSNQIVLPVVGNVSGNSLTVSPNAVGADTAVTLTVRDTGTTPTATAALTVRPGIVSNEITVTATSTQGMSCAPAICSGGDAEVAVTLSQAGVPLSGRVVRFDAISGEYRFVTSASGSAIEILDTSVSAVTDQAGRARARIRVLAGAANQTALLQATDTSSGAFQRTSFAIAQATGTSPGFFASPSSITFQGLRQEECAGTSISAIFYVFGGTPPYVVANTLSTLIVRPEIVTSSGSGFTVTPTGACIGEPGAPIIIRDTAGRTTTVSVSNIPGTAVIPALSASPTTVNLSSCDATANIQVAGGRSGNYFVASGSDALVATISGSTVTVRRRSPSGPAAAAGSIGISDGTSVVSVEVTISGAALGACTAPGAPSSLSVTPSAVSISDCTSVAQVLISGGSGSYTALSDTSSLTATVSGNILSIRRSNPSGGFITGTITVSDGIGSASIAVTGAGTGAGVCPTPNQPGTLVASPSTITLTDCVGTAQATVTGGSGVYSAASDSGSVVATVSGNVVSIRRANPSSAFTAANVTVSDGSSTTTISVNANGNGAGTCPTTSQPSAVSVNPSTVSLTDCSGTTQVTVSGGSGTYSAASSTGSVVASVSGNILSIRRASPSSPFTSATVTVTDGNTSAGVTVNGAGTGAGTCPTPAPSITASPSSVTLTDCTTTVQITASGGTGSYSAASNTGSVTTSVSGNIISIRRANPSPAFAGGIVTISDGTASTNVSVNGTGNGAGSCPTPGLAFSANPTSVTLTDCNGSAQVTLSGGSGNYTASSDSGSVIAALSGSVVSIRRAVPSSTFSGGTVLVSDGSSSINITVNATGPAQGQCSAPINATPNEIELNDCTSRVRVTLSGGNGTYIANPSSPSLLVTSISANTIEIGRRSPSQGFTSPAGVSVTDTAGTSNTNIGVRGVGAGVAACP